MRGSGSNYVRLAEFGSYPVSIDFYLSSYPGPAREIRGLRYKQGWLMLAEVNLETLVSKHSKTIIACSDLEGNKISSWLGSKLLDMRCSIPRESYYIPPLELDDIADAHYWDFLGTCDLDNLRSLEDIEVQTETRIKRLEVEYQTLSGKAYDLISRYRATRRVPDCSIENRLQIDEKIDKIEDHLDRYEKWILKQTRNIRNQAYDLEQDILESLTMEGSLQSLYIVQWRTRTARCGMELKLPLQPEERHNPGIDVNSAEAVRADEAMRESQMRYRYNLQNDEKLQPPATWKVKLKKITKADQEREIDHEKISAMLAATLGFSGS